MQSDESSEDAHPTVPSWRGSEPDAYGQAALLLAESMLHALIETKALTVDQAIDVVQTASEVKVDLAKEIGESEGRMNESIGLLAKIRRSLSTIGDHG